jgi:hypothetical protein
VLPNNNRQNNAACRTGANAQGSLLKTSALRNSPPGIVQGRHYVPSIGFEKSPCFGKHSFLSYLLESLVCNSSSKP